MPLDKWLEGLTPDDLSGDMQLIARECGMKVLLNLSKKMGGTSLYIPTLKTVKRVRRNLAIREDHRRGLSLDSLARKFGLSYRQICYILEEK